MKGVILSILLLICQVSFANQLIETIQVNHRPAAEILSAIEPFVSKQATVRAVNEYIVIKASQQEIAHIRRLIQTLDTPPQRILISVLQTDKARQQQDHDQQSAKVIATRSAVEGQAVIQNWSTQHTRNQGQYFQVRSVTGRAVEIQLGQSVPRTEQQLILFADGHALAGTQTRYLDVNRGFQAIARVLPNHQVSIDILSYASSLDKRQQSLDRNQIITTITGPVGQWLEIGKIGDASQLKQSGVTHYYSRHHRQYVVYIKLDLL